ncbi:MAG: helix-turn-helix domain-containing protein [Actinomycetota bacterium]
MVRRETGLTQVDVSRITNVSRPYVSAIEGGIVPAPAQYAAAFAAATRTTPRLIFNERGLARHLRIANLRKGGGPDGR